MLDPNSPGIMATTVISLVTLAPIFFHAFRSRDGKKETKTLMPREAHRRPQVRPLGGASLRLCACGHPEKNHLAGGYCSSSFWVGGMAKVVPCDCSTFRPERANLLRAEEEKSSEGVSAAASAPALEQTRTVAAAVAAAEPELKAAAEVRASLSVTTEPAKRKDESTLLSFYGLREQPFGVTPDPTYLYLGPAHRGALASLSLGIKSDRGFMALIAPPGMGKTTLLYQLLEEWRDSARTVFLFQTQCDSREFFRHLLGELGVDTLGMDLVSMHDKLNHLLFQEMLEGKRFVLVVDEAQNLDETVLETIRLLSDFETPHAKLLEIVLAGQPQLAAKLARPSLSQLRQRIAILTHLEPLSAAETSRYIDHRLQVAGYQGGPLFSPEAFALIAARGHGVPRIINNLCFNALSLGYAQGRRVIHSEIMHEVIANLDLDSLARESGVRQAPALGAPVPVAAPAPAPAPQLTYQPAEQRRRSGWVSRTAAVSLLVIAGVLLFPSVRKLDRTALRAAFHTAIQKITPQKLWNSRTVSAGLGTDSTGQPVASGAPAHVTVPLTVTILAGPGETLRDVSLRYLGRYDENLLEQIQALNPQLQDLNQIEAGQLIRLPLSPAPRVAGPDTAGAAADAKNTTGN
ncbi:MAG: AAA family ATPase [Acidobacteria bacterium]|nr:AAA family ATPase [Acidobacteriota bacterium]